MKRSIIILCIGLIFTHLFISCNKEVPSNQLFESGLNEDLSFLSSGTEREYHLYLPEEHQERPLVVLLHGNGSNNDELLGLSSNITAPYRVWMEIAEENDLILVVPNGSQGDSGKRGWNDCRNDAEGNPEEDDVDFISDLLGHLEDVYEYDANKVYVCGTSNGGHMAYRLAEELPSKITAFASIVSSIAANSQCIESETPVSCLFMNGTEDGILPFEGGEMKSDRGLVLSSEESIDYWITKNQTDKQAIVVEFDDLDVNDSSSVRKSTYSNGLNNTEVVLYEIEGGGHTEPSIKERYSNVFKILVGEQNGDIEMAEEVWNFFKNKSK